MKVAFFISSVGDSSLAIKTVDTLTAKGQHEAVLIALTQTAQNQVDKCSLSSSLITKMNTDAFGEGTASAEQVAQTVTNLKNMQIDYAYIGVPSDNNELPFQLAQALDIPVLMAYEYMFTSPNTHLWNYVPQLSQKANVYWGVPLTAAKADFKLPDEKMLVTGHLSIDNAVTASHPTAQVRQEIKDKLHCSPAQSLAFVSSTTCALEVDAEFIDCLLTELKSHPQIQVRLGLHPGRKDQDMYLQKVLAIYQQHPAIAQQFKIILPDNMVAQIKEPELTVNNPKFEAVLLRVNCSGAEASAVADRVAQAVPGALTNQSALEGKPTYSHTGAPYLPREYFSANIASFFTAEPQKPRSKKDLHLYERTAPEVYARIITG